jgi:hypothetical protein
LFQAVRGTAQAKRLEEEDSGSKVPELASVFEKELVFCVFSGGRVRNIFTKQLASKRYFLFS